MHIELKFIVGAIWIVIVIICKMNWPNYGMYVPKKIYKQWQYTNALISLCITKTSQCKMNNKWQYKARHGDVFPEYMHRYLKTKIEIEHALLRNCKAKKQLEYLKVAGPYRNQVLTSIMIPIGWYKIVVKDSMGWCDPETLYVFCMSK